LEAQPPKVFISHATEDKDRFVNDFATKLRNRGIDAWIDRWEMLAGDSLVDKIFEEGIKNAQAMVIVLSKFSVVKSWVREELNAGVVKRISGQYKIIPVVIDDCEIPQSLQSIIRVRVEDINNYDEELESIVSSIYGHFEKPSLGSPPKYTQLNIASVPSLSTIDTVVLKTICEVSQEIGAAWVHTQQVKGRTKDLGISDGDLYESIDILSERYFVKGQGTFGSRGIDFFQITPAGFESYAKVFLPDFSNLVDQVLVSIVNQHLDTNTALSIHLGNPIVLINYALDVLDRRGHIKIGKTMGGGVHVTMVTTQGKRSSRAL
jgi:TIR domain